MIRGKYHFTSESVTEGHPDKLCDQISDGVLDAILEKDSEARVAVESLATTGLVVVAGEVSTEAYIDIQEVVRKVIKEAGYDKLGESGFNYDDCSVLVSLHEQSPDISKGVTKKTKERQGAGDQGLMFGYATNETKEFMPLPIMLSHKITQKLAELRKSGDIPWIRTDGKAQVTIEYEDGKPIRADTVVVSTQHSSDVKHEQIVKEIKEKIILPVCGDWLDEKTNYHINPTGAFIRGGPGADTGLTGRKIIVDTYGGVGSHGGGCFSGKDPSKVDRSASYMARHLAKNIVAAELADRCEVQIAYAIGVSEPVSVYIDTFGTGKYPEAEIKSAVLKVFDLRPGKIIDYLNLKRPIYRKTAAYGHFGRSEAEFTWEKTDRVQELKELIGA
ncbi:TPA: methionine adenosyltransferase [archaeon]|nr:methionine adenosyltransferase [Candidatus Undinarchaeales archaeon SRR5007147.bin71]